MLYDSGMKKYLLMLMMALELYSNTIENTQLNMYCFDDVKNQELVQIVYQQETLFTSSLLPTKTSFKAGASVWCKLELINQSHKEVSKVVKFLDIRLDQIYTYAKTGDLISTQGDRLPFINRVHKDAQSAVDISAKPKETKVLLLNIKHRVKMDITYMVYEKETYEEHVIHKNMIHAFFLGTLVVMLLYNFVLYLLIRERVFLEYVMYHFVLLIVMLYYNGIVSQYFHPEAYDVNAGSVPMILITLSIILATVFVRDFLEVKKYTPRLDKIIIVFLGMNFFLLILDVFQLSHLISGQLSVMLMIPQSMFLLYISAYHTFALKRMIALFYLLGWSLMMVSIVVTGFLSLGLIPRNDVTSYMFQIGSFVEIVLLSMGLAYRYNESKNTIANKDKELEKINANLEIIIAERTQELDVEVAHTKALLADKEILFKELYHRVKNNLQMLTSLLSMQLTRLDDVKSKEVLQDFIGRIKSLALLHEKLQGSDQVNSIGMQEYLGALIEEMKNTTPLLSYEVHLEANNLYLKIDQVTPIGLIINELVSNSIKHAFKDVDTPEITIHLIAIDENNIELSYSDNGVGVLEIDRSKSLGTILIETLAKSQLKGTIEVITMPSLSYQIIFPKI